jgi:aminoglycoside phosphotransferase (APT) family kinase protein
MHERMREAKLPEYPQLSELMAGDQLADALQSQMGARFHSGELQVSRVDVTRVYYKPGKRGECRLQLRAAIQDRKGVRLGDQLYCGQIWPESALRRQAAAARSQTLVPPAFGEPLSLLDDWNLLLWAFPNDPELPALVELSQPERLVERVRTRPQSFGLPAAARIVAADTRVKKYVPARRCLFEFRIDYIDPQGASGSHRVFGKAYREGQGRKAYRRLRALFEGALPRSGPLRLPEPYGCDESLDLVLQEPLRGLPLSQALADPRLPALATLAGRGIAALHAMELQLPERWTLTAEQGELATKVEAVAQAFPRHAARCRALRARLLDEVPRMGAPGRATVHGAFRMSHVFAAGDRVGLIDLDRSGRGEPAHDLGRFAAHLIEAQVRGRIEEQAAQQVIRALVEGHRAASATPVSELHMRWFTASHLLTGQLYKLVKRVDAGLIEELLGCAERIAPQPGCGATS